MKNIEGLYTAIGNILEEKQDENRLAIDVGTIMEEVKEQVDVYSASMDWYVRFALRAAIEVSLYQRGYRSVVKGEGLFVNPADCEKPEYMARLFNNAELTRRQKETVVGMIKKAIKTSNMDGQLAFDFETGLIKEDITEQKLIEMLKADAGAA
jgi:hypothetical protein